MARFLRVSLIVAAVAALAATGASALVPDPDASTTPDVISATPDGSFPYTVVVRATGGTPVPGALVEVWIEDSAFPLWSQCVGQVATSEPDGLKIGSGNAGGGGSISFFFDGGGCINVGGGGPYVSRVEADGILFREPTINSPDIVNTAGERPEEVDENTCAPQGGGGTATVGLSDAVEHTQNIALGLVDRCSNFTGPNFDDGVGLPDAVILTDYIVEGTTCTCVN
jgi:hypothetical protein